MNNNNKGKRRSRYKLEEKTGPGNLIEQAARFSNYWNNRRESTINLEKVIKAMLLSKVKKNLISHKKTSNGKGLRPNPTQ